MPAAQALGHHVASHRASALLKVKAGLLPIVPGRQTCAGFSSKDFPSHLKDACPHVLLATSPSRVTSQHLMGLSQCWEELRVGRGRLGSEPRGILRTRWVKGPPLLLPWWKGRAPCF